MPVNYHTQDLNTFTHCSKIQGICVVVREEWKETQ